MGGNRARKNSLAPGPDTMEFLTIQSTDPETYNDDVATAVNENGWTVNHQTVTVCCTETGPVFTYFAFLSRTAPPELMQAMRKTTAKRKRK